jgi:hypothetical protein
MMISAQHISDKDIDNTIVIDVGTIDAHGKGARMAQSQSGDGMKSSFPVIDPNSIWRKQVIANINVRSPISVQIMKLD